jgi:hypothetical protein
LSILGQTFTDFEVIVGSDYVKGVLSAGLLGIENPRIRFVNHIYDLGKGAEKVCFCTSGVF